MGGRVGGERLRKEEEGECGDGREANPWIQKPKDLRVYFKVGTLISKYRCYLLATETAISYFNHRQFPLLFVSTHLQIISLNIS